MNDTQRPPVYAVVDTRVDGCTRVVAEFAEPIQALDAAKLLRWAGTPAKVVLITEWRDARPEGGDAR